MAKMTPHQVAVAAEAFAAGVLAQAGCSVFVQYGANQPGYDLHVAKGDNSIKVSVKGSQNGMWILTSKKADGTYEQALRKWADDNKAVIFCYVQFGNVALGAMPRMYLVRGDELAAFMQTHAFGGVGLSLIEDYTPQKGPNRGKTMRVPATWRLSEQRINQMFLRE